MKAASNVKQTKSVVGVRSHKISGPENILCEELSLHFGAENVFYVIDATPYDADQIKDMNEKYTNIIYFSRQSLIRKHLKHDLPSVGWLCGDYFYYFLKEAVEADYYWLIEPDVRFTFNHLDDLFIPFEKVTEDLIMPYFGERKNGWFWYTNGKILADKVFGGAFPITRMSSSLIQDLLFKRQELTVMFEEKGLAPDLWPNDESFSATVAVAQGFYAKAMESCMPGLFKHFSTANPYLFPSAAKHLSHNAIIHPAMERNEFLLSFRKKLNKKMNWQSLDPILKTSLLGLSEKELKEVKAIAAQTLERKINQLHTEINKEKSHLKK